MTEHSIKQDDRPVMLTVEQVHKEFGIASQRIRVLTKSGYFKGFNAGRKLLINRQSVIDFLNSTNFNI